MIIVNRQQKTAKNFIKDILRNTRGIFNTEQKIQIVVEALRVEMSVAELCRKYSINKSQFYKWNKGFLEAGKKRLSGDTAREAYPKFKKRFSDSSDLKYETRKF